MNTVQLHASAVMVSGRALLIRGASGKGKSALALQLIALGARLIADDQVVLSRRGDTVVLSKPEGLPALIEARGIGLLHAPRAQAGVLHAIVDLDVEQTERLPEPQVEKVLGVPVNVIPAVAAQHFPSAIFLYLTHGREESL